MAASLICFQQFAGGFVGVWGFLVFLRMAVAGLIVGWLASGRYLRLTPGSWLRSWAALRGLVCWRGLRLWVDSFREVGTFWGIGLFWGVNNVWWFFVGHWCCWGGIGHRTLEGE